MTRPQELDARGRRLRAGLAAVLVRADAPELQRLDDVGKLLASAPLYVAPASEKRIWFFLGLASYEGALRGAIRPGFIATYAQDDQDPDPSLTGAPPRKSSARRCWPCPGRCPWPASRCRSLRAASTPGSTSRRPFAVPSWARPRSDRKVRPIAGGSDAEFIEGTVTSGPP